jgi:hypothetical protein
VPTLKREFKLLALKLQEVAQPFSQTDVARSLNACIRDKDPNIYCYVCDIFGDADSGDVVYYCAGDYFRAPYQMGNADGKRTCTIDFEQAIDVLPRTVYDEEAAEGSTWKPEGTLLVESAAHFLDEPKLQEAAGAAYPIKLISPGRGSSGYYSEGVLRKAAESNVFRAGTQMFWNHDTEAEEGARPEGDLNRLAAVTTSDARWDEAGRDGPGLYAQAKVFADYADQVKEKGPHIGLSIRAGGSRDNEAKGPDGRAGVITALHNAMSVDFVTRAGRDGKIFTEAATSESTAQGADMTEQEIKALMATSIKEAIAPVEAENKRLRAQLSRQQAPATIREALKDIRLPDASKNKIIRRLAETELPTEAKDLNELIESEARSEAQFLQELGYRNVEAIGARMTEAEVREQGAAGEKDHKESYQKSMDTLCNLFIGSKLRAGSDEAKALRDEAREAFVDGRAA